MFSGPIHFFAPEWFFKAPDATDDIQFHTLGICGRQQLRWLTDQGLGKSTAVWIKECGCHKLSQKVKLRATRHDKMENHHETSVLLEVELRPPLSYMFGSCKHPCRCEGTAVAKLYTWCGSKQCMQLLRVVKMLFCPAASDWVSTGVVAWHGLVWRNEAAALHRLAVFARTQFSQNPFTICQGQLPPLCTQVN